MGGYIGATAVGLTTTAADVQGDITSTDTTPELILKNTSEEDTEGGREGKITFKGEQSGGEESTLAQIESAHDGTSDDEKGDLIFKTNDGSDGASPTERVRIDSNGSILTATLGTDNVHLGEGAGASIASGGTNNTLIGKDAGTAITTGDNNTAIGHDAGKSITTGTVNTFVGNLAGDATTTSHHNTGIGHQALTTNVLGSNSVAVGSFALNSQNPSSATDMYNTAVGYNAGQAVTTGTNNTAIGGLALDALTTAASNTAVGQGALGANQTANSNTAVGKGAGASTTVAAGTYVGTQAGENTNSVSNTFIGCSAGELVTSGQKNTILGRYNGNEDGLDIRTSSNNIAISDGDGKVRLRCNQYGALSVRTDIDQGIYVFTGGTNNTNGKAIEFYDGDGHSCGVIRINQSANTVSYNTSSDHRLKENVTDLTGATTRLKQLQPKRFNFILDPNDTVHDGFMAHEVQTVVPEAISGTHNEVDDDGNPVYQGIDQSKLVPLLTAALQEAITKIETLETQNTTQATQIADLITRVEALEGA